MSCKVKNALKTIKIVTQGYLRRRRKKITSVTLNSTSYEELRSKTMLFFRLLVFK